MRLVVVKSNFRILLVPNYRDLRIRQAELPVTAQLNRLSKSHTNYILSSAFNNKLWMLEFFIWGRIYLPEGGQSGGAGGVTGRRPQRIAVGRLYGIQVQNGDVYLGGGAFVIFLSRVYQARDISHPGTGVSKRKGHCQMPKRELFYTCAITQGSKKMRFPLCVFVGSSE